MNPREVIEAYEGASTLSSTQQTHQGGQHGFTKFDEMTSGLHAANWSSSPPPVNGKTALASTWRGILPPGCSSQWRFFRLKCRRSLY